MNPQWGRYLSVTNGGLLEVYLVASQQAVLDCTYAAIPVSRGRGSI
jgi:hypothetical protein